MSDDLEETLSDIVSDVLLQWQQTFEASGFDESNHVGKLEVYQHCAAVEIAAIKMTLRGIADKLGIDVILTDVRVTQVEPTQIEGAAEPEPEPLDGGWSNAKVDLGRGFDVYRRGDRVRRKANLP